MTSNVFSLGKYPLHGLLLWAAFVSTVAFADNHTYLGVTFGATTGTIGHRNNTINTSTSTDNYTTNSTYANTSMFGLNGGYEFTGANWIPTIALGLGIYDMPSTYNENGQLVQQPIGGGTSSFYNFKYTINSARVMIESQLKWQFHAFLPYFSLGVGPSWNQLSRYDEAPTNGTGPVTLPAFQSHTNSNLAYQIGLGVEYAFGSSKKDVHFKQERIGLGYRHVNLGAAVFETRGNTYPYQLKTGKLQTNDIFLTYKHLF